MRIARLFAYAMTLSACDQVFRLEPIDEPPVFVPFSEPMPLPGAVNSPGEDDDPTLTGDLLELYFVRAGNLFRSTRSTIAEPWRAAVAVTELNTTTTEMRPCISRDGSTLYFTRGTLGTRELFVSTRPPGTTTWSAPALVELDLNSPNADEHCGWSSPDGLTMFVEASNGGDFDLYIATRPAIGAPFVTVPFTEINQPDSYEGGAWTPDDRSSIIFQTDRTATMAIWEAIEKDDVWHLHRHVELDANRTDGDPWLSPDGKVIVFSRTTTNDELYFATR